MKISEEERELRVENVRGALAINSVGADVEPCAYTMELFQRYIDGEMEPDQLVKEIVRYYTVLEN